jgi:predicted RecB family nuclease
MGDDGDRTGWERFLEAASRIFATHGDIKFVHYAHYEKTMIASYVQRYGDPAGVSGRVLGNLLDLYGVVRDTIVLPDSSYSLKLIEHHAGFKRSQESFGGQWSIAKYIEAVETRDAGRYEDLLGEVLLYNREDLEAMWAVFAWLARSHGPGIDSARRR